MCNHFSIIPTHYASKMCSIGISARERRQNWTFVIKCLRHPHNFKTCDFTSSKWRERLQNAQKRNMPVQIAENYCFSLLKMQICDILVVVVDVFASAPYWFSLYYSLHKGPRLLCIITICCQDYLRNRFMAEIESRNVFEWANCDSKGV